MKLRIGCVLVAFLSAVLPMAAQTSTSGAPSAQVPPVIQFSNVASNEAGNPLTGTVQIKFSLYNNSQGGEPLWSENQNVTLDGSGHFSVYVGITTPNGVPMSLFTTGQAHWLGVQIAGQTEQPRVFLVSVPYAMKAGDAATIGGLPPSAFVLAAPPLGTTSSVSPESTTAQPATTGTTPMTTAGGRANQLAKFDASADVTNSIIFDNGTDVGIGTATPASKLDIKGGSTVRGTLTLPATGTATNTPTGGKNSQPLKLSASAFNSGTGTAVSQNFQWQAEPVGNDTSATSGTMNLLYATGSNKIAETGFSIARNGQIAFAPGQTFPGTGTGNGSVTNIVSGLGLTGGPITTSGTLASDPTAVPQLAAANTFSGKQTIKNTTIMTVSHYWRSR